MAALPRHMLDEIRAFAMSDAVEALLDGLRAEYEQNWGATASHEKDRREHLYHMVQAVDGLKSEIRRVAQKADVDFYVSGRRRKPDWS